MLLIYTKYDVLKNCVESIQFQYKQVQLDQIYSQKHLQKCRIKKK